MNILFIGLYPPHIGGIATHTSNLRKRMLAKGHKVFVVTYRHDSPMEKDVHMVRTSSALRGLSFIKKAPRVVEKVILENDIDIIHSHYLAPPGYVGGVVSEKYNIPNIVTAHGSDINFMYRSVIGKYLINRALEKTDRVICVSKTLKRHLEAITDKPCVYIPNGVDTSQFIPSENEKEYILYIGSLVQQKNVDHIIDELAGTKERLVIAGDGTLRPKLEWLARERKVNTEFLGYVEDVPRLMKKAKTLVLPSTAEGFGLVVLEAMAAGVPAICRNSSTIREFVEDGVNGLLYDSKEQLKEKLMLLESDDKLRNKIIKKGIETSKLYKWENVVDKTLTEYKSLVKITC